MFNKHSFINTNLKFLALAILTLGVHHTVSAAETVKDVSKQVAQVVIFNDGSVSRNGSANVYIDRHFNAALKPNEYTVSCVYPGQHSIETYFNDAPRYAGKNNPQMTANTQGGHTYFLSVTSSGTPLAVSNDVGSRAISTANKSKLINRSSTVVPCDYSSAVQDTVDVTFAFNGSRLSDISSNDITYLRNWISNVVSSNAYSQVIVTGFSDAIGHNSYNLLLSKRRAQTVTNLLINAGIRPGAIEVDGKGTSVVKARCSSSSSRSEAIACNQANRRVSIRIIK